MPIIKMWFPFKAAAWLLFCGGSRLGRTEWNPT